MSTAKVDLFKLSRVTNRLIFAFAFAVLFFVAGWRITCWFHFLTVFFLMLTVMKLFWGFGLSSGRGGAPAVGPDHPGGSRWRS